MSRSIVYIDGFNFYYGAIRGGPYKWLNLEKFFRLLRPADQIQRITYFTAKVIGSTLADQITYWRALATLPSVKIIEGKYKMKRVQCGVKACDSTCDKYFPVPEEKRTDVNIAVQMLDDAYQDLCDRFILVSGDSDLVPGISCLKSRFPEKQVIVYVPTRDPTRGAAVELRAAADKDRNLPLNLLQHSMFPANVPDGTGGMIARPTHW